MSRLILPTFASQVGEVIGRFERKGFKLVALKMQTPSRQLAEEHYADLSSKPFFKDLVNYIISGPVVCMVSSVFGIATAVSALSIKDADACAPWLLRAKRRPRSSKLLARSPPPAGSAHPLHSHAWCRIRSLLEQSSVPSRFGEVPMTTMTCPMRVSRPTRSPYLAHDGA